MPLARTSQIMRMTATEYPAMAMIMAVVVTAVIMAVVVTAMIMAVVVTAVVVGHPKIEGQ